MRWIFRNGIFIPARLEEEKTLSLECVTKIPKWYPVVASEKLQHLIWSKMREYGLPDIYAAIIRTRDQGIISKRFTAIERIRRFVRSFEIIAPDFTRRALHYLKMMEPSLNCHVRYYFKLNIALAELGDIDVKVKRVETPHLSPEEFYSFLLKGIAQSNRED